ncbi:two-component system chemotaxis response regulator CheB [Clostridium saccharobutylicum]|uniref:protein-glutamate methylesterase/protein-glutamine glutaminase n=1 Tax=Clostridium saccharobutylicum TaxID=169679 RepID=UPI00149477F8|nr:chemotaxis response regulator protein-glutamate methylesterase [Clostridium saccharobutylicum]NOV65613.1 two-component system chemotaxis response regulator CheB [Clostridium saccharobutylicum]
MQMVKKIKVLVVDDSMLFREVLSRGISSDPYIEVVAIAVDAFDARDKILEFQPDVMTCDVEMPKMNGIEFIRRLLPQYKLPVIVVSTVSEAVFDAINAGAVDFVTKPDVQSAKSVESFINDLIVKIKIAAVAKVSMSKSISAINSVTSEASDTDKIIAIGASTGGTEAIHRLLSHLPKNTPGIVIVKHIPPIFSRMFAERLNNCTNLKVKEAQTGDFLENGKVLIAPGDKHMIIRKVGSMYKVECFYGDKVNGHCPSVDVLFESVAKACGNKAIGIILTGMGYDGAKGLLSMRKCGARTLGQDEKSSIVYGMPKVAYNIGAVEKQVSLDNLPQKLFSMLR